ncbi:ParA family protein [Motiliproteus sp. MSK22-1]|uniref:ParA family protein n=1 Tax=Motiliproteus sp. MSK22-1 TaxID=1897630 RepID=UPI0009753AA9|nr:ParA family protein [Motiliproteus sp. MSK22-1]OMH30238.1 cobyric acid synthase [Motiliproteus sp. MSK22-1]
MRRVVFNQKGGVGKSSIATNLAAISANKGFRTLLVDLDPQCNASQYLLGREIDKVENDAMDFFEHSLAFKMRGIPPQEYISNTRFKNLSLLASNPKLGDLHSKLEAKHKIYKLREALDGLEGFDYVYIDTPPAFNFYTLSALVAAQGCLIPFDCDEFSRQALYSLLENVQETVEDHNDELRVEGIVINQFQPRATLPRQMVDSLKAEELPVMASYLSSSVKMKESHNESIPLIHYAPKHKLTQEFVALFDELHS